MREEREIQGDSVYCQLGDTQGLFAVHGAVESRGDNTELSCFPTAGKYNFFFPQVHPILPLGRASITFSVIFFHLEKIPFVGA